MSIAAVIEGISRLPDGTDRLTLGPISKDDGPGQPVLFVVNPPQDFHEWDGWIGEPIWGGCSSLIHGRETEFAKRRSYLEIELVAGALQQAKVGTSC